MAISKQKAAAVLILVLLKQKSKLKKQRKRKWVREWIQRRDSDGITQKLINEMRGEDSNGFREFVRMSSDQFDFLLNRVQPIISKKDTNMRKAISAETRLLITLRYLASGDSYRSLTFLFRVPHNTISGIIPQVCKAIYDTLCVDYLKVFKSTKCDIKSFFCCDSYNTPIICSLPKVPNTAEEWIRIANDFNSKWHFPNCIGALDGKHITIRCPKNSGSLNFNYKHTFSIVLMALADANYKFTYIDVGCKGRVSDGGVYSRCSLYQAIETNSLNIPPPRRLPGSDTKTPFVILADDAFALKTYMLKPYNFRNQNLDERIFNYRLSRARRMVESSFGIMATRFRLLRTTIELNEKNIKLCSLAICALHNFLLSVDKNSYLLSNRETRQVENDQRGNESEFQTTNNEHDGKQIREIFKNYFVSPVGEVNWQYDMA